MVYLEIEQIMHAGACYQQINVLKELWPDGKIPLTIEAMKRAADSGVRVKWAVHGLLSEGAQSSWFRSVYTARTALAKAEVDATLSFGLATESARGIYNKSVIRAQELLDTAITASYRAEIESLALAKKDYEESAVPDINVYEELVAAHQKICSESIASAKASYKQTLSAACAAYFASIIPALEARETAIAPVRSAYESVALSALLSLLLQENERRTF